MYDVCVCVCVIAVKEELKGLLDSLLGLQQSLLSRHRDTCSLATAGPPNTDRGGGGTVTAAVEAGQGQSSDEEIPSDLESDDKGSEGEEGEGEDGEEREGNWQERQRRKRKCPWVSVPIFMLLCNNVCRYHAWVIRKHFLDQAGKNDYALFPQLQHKCA